VAPKSGYSSYGSKKEESMEATRTRTAGPVTSGRFALARVVALIGGLVAAVIVIGILLIVFDANARADVVEWLTDAARWLAGPFHGLFNLDSEKWQTAVNWGLAAVVYFALSRVVARALAR
jgi:hypothetical protein